MSDPTATVTDPAFLALHALRLRGTLAPEAAAEIVGLDPAEAASLLRAAEAAGLVSFQIGRAHV